MKIRPIDIKDNRELSLVIRSVLIEMGVPKTGTAYEDEELDAMYESYLGLRAIYYVITEGEKILGGAGIAPLQEGDPSVCELQKMYFSPKVRGKGLGHQMIDTCIDFAKWVKDYQFMLYGTISSVCLIQFNTYINSKRLPGNCHIPT